MADYAGHPRIRFALAPHTVHTTSDAILQHTCMQAEAYDTPWIIHAAEDLAELQKTLQKYGRRPIPLLDSLGCLTPRSVIVHGVEILEPEMHRLAAAETSVVHCPRSNAKLGSGFAPVTRLLANGVNVALGTDGAASSNSLNMFAEMSLASLFAKHREADAAALPARTVLDMATRNGAQALAWPELGWLEAGGPADLCAVSLRQARLTPCFDPVSHLVHACGGAGVVLTMADGAILYDHGSFPTIDHAGLVAAAREALAWARDRLAEISA